MNEKMSDLDENLTSILSSLIDTEGIETPNATELTDNSAFNGSRLDFDNLASCITGNDASLHQGSDENVSSLLESHLNDLSQTENASIVEATTEHLDDVTPFDLDKPIESLLESGPSEFISQECSDAQLSVVEKSVEIQCVSNELSLTESQIQSDLENVQSILNICNQNAGEASNSLHESNETEKNVNEVNCSLTSSHLTEEIESNGQLQGNIESNLEIEDHANQSTNRNDLDGEVLRGDEPCETIIADENATRGAIPSHVGKKRRRILVYNDSDNSELDEEREKLRQSKSPTPSHRSTEQDGEIQKNRTNDEYSNASNDERDEKCEDVDDYVRDPNEKPGPKSKKQSTYLYNALKAKALLESAVVIPARKKKKRVIDSDDEYNDSIRNQPIASVDDIGLIPDDNNLLPFDVAIEGELKISTCLVESESASTADEIQVRNELVTIADKEIVDAKPFIKKEGLSRAVTQAKMEKYHVSDYQRLSHKQKESKDNFGLPLNAPYVDSSSDDDYFVTSDINRRGQPHHLQHWSNNGSTLHSSSTHQKRKRGHIPDDVYFNAKAPLHVLYSYDDSSSGDEKDRSTPATQRSSFQPTNRTFNKMPPVHKIVPRTLHVKSKTHKIVSKHPARMDKNVKPVAKPTVFEQLDKLKRLLRASGIKVNASELLKGSKTFQERCKRIRDILYRNGIEGEPTMAKCKKLRKQLKLKEEIAGLDPSVIIESKEDDGRPKRTTRRATRRNYVYDEINETKKSLQPEMNEDTSQLLQKIKEFIDSDSEYEGDKNQQNDCVEPTNIVETDLTDSTEQILSSEIESNQTIQTAVDNLSSAQCTISVSSSI